MLEESIQGVVKQWPFLCSVHGISSAMVLLVSAQNGAVEMQSQCSVVMVVVFSLVTHVIRSEMPEA